MWVCNSFLFECGGIGCCWGSFSALLSYGSFIPFVVMVSRKEVKKKSIGLKK
jgi:hypothetical protein